MHELFTFLIAELRGTWRFRWYALAVAWLVALAGAVVILDMPDQYSVNARVQVDTDSMLGPLLSGLTVAPDMGTRVRLLTETLLNRSNLERIARESDLMLRARTPLEEEEMLEELARNIDIHNPGRRGNVYGISYSSSNPRTATRVVQSVLDILLERSMGMSLADSASATGFLEGQVEEYENRLRAAEQRLASFKRENIGLLPEQGGRDYYQRLRAAEETLEQLESSLRAATNQRTSLQREVTAMESGRQIQTTNNPRIIALDESIRRSNDRLDELLLRFTTSHPDVVAQRAQIERQLEERLEIASQPMPTQARDLNSNPVYLELQIRMNDVNSEIASLQTQISDQQQRIERLVEQVDEITRVETRLADLSRDYDVMRSRHQTLLTRLSAAEMSSLADASGGQLQFRIIDPPVEPLRPSGPPRQAYLLALIPISFGIGGGFAFLLHQIRPVFQNRRLLSELTGRPVLGSVNLIMSLKQRSMKLVAISIFGLACMVLVAAVTASTLYVETGAELVQAALRRLSL